jgi:hypothetical protein
MIDPPPSLEKITMIRLCILMIHGSTSVILTTPLMIPFGYICVCIHSMCLKMFSIYRSLEELKLKLSVVHIKHVTQF